jgi:L,D-peptidoglycan transpeptidase YkuD (ErfK/YbiS/YcfS/YnhG family)
MKTLTDRSQSRAQLLVRALGGQARRGFVLYGGLRIPCALGRTGRRAIKREGDGATPIGRFAVRQAFYRADRMVRPRTRIPLAPIRKEDGWCDDPMDRNYNRYVRHPYPASAERLWRADGLYDLVIVIGHNDRPRVLGGGSAIFIHVAGANFEPTEGCIALRLPDLRRLMSHLRRGNVVNVLA